MFTSARFGRQRAFLQGRNVSRLTSLSAYATKTHPRLRVDTIAAEPTYPHFSLSTSGDDLIYREP
ncbi:MAG: hypothetical protein ACOX3A_06015 [bacterium]